MIIVAAILFSATGLALDYYVYRNWKPFGRRRWPWTLPVFAAGMIVMAVLVPVGIVVARLWVADPRPVQHVIMVAWAMWYIPKVPIAGVLLIKDVMRFATWLFGWLQARLRVEEPAERRGDLSELPHISRSEFLRRVGWTAAGVPFAIVGYGAFRSLYDFQVRNVAVRIPHLPRALDGLRIAQLSDLHAGSMFSEEPIKEVVNLVLQERPDLIALTGDYVNNDHRELPTILPQLERLTAPLGVYAVRGNHDHYAHVRRVSDLLQAAGPELLVNDARTLLIDGARLHVLGTDNTGFRQNYGDLSRALARTVRNGEDAHLLLAHDPTFWDLEVRPAAPQIDLTLSGHTHGGQVGFELGPFRWSVARVAYDRWAGLYTEAGSDRLQHLYVNRGIGTVGPPVRIGMRPEITILTLLRA